MGDIRHAKLSLRVSLKFSLSVKSLFPNPRPRINIHANPGGSLRNHRGPSSDFVILAHQAHGHPPAYYKYKRSLGPPLLNSSDSPRTSVLNMPKRILFVFTSVNQTLTGANTVSTSCAYMRHQTISRCLSYT